MWQLPDIQVLQGQGVHGAVAVAIAMGTLYCFLGYRTLRFVIALTGFLLAGAVAGVLGAWIGQGNPAAICVGGAIGGVCGALALTFVYRAGVFLLGFLGVLLIGMCVAADMVEAWAPWMVLGGGIAGGLIALLVERPVVILATSAIGAWMVVNGVAFFLVGPDILEYGQGPVGLPCQAWIALASWAVLAMGGALAQFATYQRSGSEGEQDD